MCFIPVLITFEENNNSNNNVILLGNIMLLMDAGDTGTSLSD